MHHLTTYQRIKNGKIFFHHGRFRRELSLWEGVILIVSGTIGAGVLGIPYAIAQSGVLIGVLSIFGIGLFMMGLNLLIGEVALRTGKTLQLPGLAKKYLGNFWGSFMTLMVYLILFGVLVVYIIGEGATLAALFGGPHVLWSTLFFIVGAILVASGLRTIEKIDFILLFGILSIVIFIAALSLRHVDVSYMKHINIAQVLFPYGVILFAFHSTTAIPEAYSLLKNKGQTFRRAIIYASVITIVVYAVFSLVVVGVTGEQTTEIATIGLGKKIGAVMFLLGNLFAFFSMLTSYLMASVAVKDSLTWDYKVPQWASLAMVIGIPYIVFLAGIRGFISALDIIGGVFGSIEMILIVFIYWKARQMGHLNKNGYRLHHALLLSIVLLTALSIGAAYSVIKLF